MFGFLVLGAFLLSPQLPQSAPTTPTSPGITTATTTKTELSSLTVAARGSQDGYSRALFPR